MGNTIGKLLTLTTFGESHGVAIGGVLDGFPSRIKIDFDFIQSELTRRRSGTAFFSSSRLEEDHIEFLSGIFNGYSTGTPIAFLVQNKDHKPEDYTEWENLYRPSHADFTYEKKYGIRDHRGGGRSSARETVARVIGGAFAKLLLQEHGITIKGFVNQIGPIALPGNFPYLKSGLNTSTAFCPDPETEVKMLAFLETIKAEGDTVGGVIHCSILNVPVGLGEPVFDKLQADLAKAMLSINAVKGFDYGSGFMGATMKGSQHNDGFVTADSHDAHAVTSTNFSGGIQGGISNGEEIFFRVAFKPISTLMHNQETIDRSGNKTIMHGKGRHDVCVVPRAIPIVEAMAALVIADHLLRSKAC